MKNIENPSQPIDPPQKKRRGRPRINPLPPILTEAEEIEKAKRIHAGQVKRAEIARANKNGKLGKIRHTEKQKAWLHAYLTNGRNLTAASKAVGISAYSAAAHGTKMFNMPAVQEELTRLREKSTDLMVYSLETAVAEINEKLAKAVDLEQMTAAARFLEMKLKLSGHLVDRMDINVTRVDLKGILDDANNRARSVIIDAVAEVIHPVPPGDEENPFG